MRISSAVAFGAWLLAASAACTSLLGDFEVQSGPPGALEGGAGGDGSQGPIDSAAPPLRDAFDEDGPIGPGNCAPPRAACSGACVDLAEDDKHCGACDRSCLGASCTSRRCLAGLVASRNDVEERSLVATETDLFFATKSGEVFQLPLSGASALRLAAPRGEVAAVSAAGGRVFFSVNLGNGIWELWSATPGVVMSGVSHASRNGNPVSIVAAGASVHALVIVVALNESFEVVTCPQVAGSGNCIPNFAGPGRPGNRAAAGAGQVFWTDQLDGAIYAMPDTAGPRLTISKSEATPSTIAWDGMGVFWSNGGTSVIRRSPFPVTAPEDFRTLQSAANDLVADGTYVYFSQNDGGSDRLFALPRATPSSVPITLAIGNIGRLTHNSLGVYWVNAQGIHVVRKP